MSARPLVLSWLWAQADGRTTYNAFHVNVWADQISRNLAIDHDIACVTDTPDGIDPRVRIIPPPRDFEAVTVPRWGRGRPNCFRRLALFRRDAADLFGAERLISMDLDVVIAGPLDSLFAGGEDFRICTGTAPGRTFNGSMMMVRAGARAAVYETFSQAAAVDASNKFVGSDQAWLSHVLGKRGEKTWGPEDGVLPWQQRHFTKAPRLMTFPGSVKPWQIAEHGADRFVSQHYRRSPGGRALVLSYGPHVWRDLDAALDRPFDAVIASPEVAAHWPGSVMIADDDRHAERMAAMHGFSEAVWCGRGGVDAVAV